MILKGKVPQRISPPSGEQLLYDCCQIKMLTSIWVSIWLGKQQKGYGYLSRSPLDAKGVERAHLQIGIRTLTAARQYRNCTGFPYFLAAHDRRRYKHWIQLWCDSISKV